jgi:hypothetical protein
MFTTLPRLQYTSAPVKTTNPAALTVTVPQGSDALVVQALTQNVYIEYDGIAPSTDSQQIIADLDPRVIRASSGTVFKFSTVTAGAVLIHRYARVHDRP